MSNTVDILYGVLAADELRAGLGGTYILSAHGYGRSTQDKHIRVRFFTKKTEALAFKNEQAPASVIFRFEVTTPDDGVYTVKQNSDQTEGRGSMVPVASFTNFKAALEISRGRGVMGYGDGEVELVSRDASSLYESAAQFRAALSGKKPRRGESKVILYSSYFGGHVDYFKAVRRVA